jgi:hypothetical protein
MNFSDSSTCKINLQIKINMYKTHISNDFSVKKEMSLNAEYPINYAHLKVKL